MTIKLNSQQVQEIRQLRIAGFTVRSIASAYDVSHGTVTNILTGKSWAFLAHHAVELPVLSHDQAVKLRLPAKTRRLTKQQQRIIEQFRNRLALAIDDSADREATAIALMNQWRPQRPRMRREIVTQRMAASAGGAGSNFL